MARIHVFAIDWVPAADDITSGGGLRSLQVIEALRLGGHRVSFSVPLESRTVQAMRLTASDRMRAVEVHTNDNQLDILRHSRPDVVVWLWPAARNVSFSGLGDMVHVCDLNGLQDYEGANGNQALIKIARARVVAGVRGSDAVLTGSPEQFGYWLAQLGDAQDGPAITLAGYGLPPLFQAPVVSSRAKLRTLHFSGNVYSWSASTALLQRCAAWTNSNPAVTLKILGGIDPGGATSLADLQVLADLARDPTVTIEQEMSFPAAMALYQPGSVALDLNEINTERQLAVPIRTVNAMMHGVPIISTLDTLLLRRMERAGAAILVPRNIPNGLEQTIDQLAARTPSDIGAMAVAARIFAEQEFSFTDSARAINDVVDRAVVRRRRQVQSWTNAAPPETRLEHVLVISGEPANLRELRVDLPFAALQRRRLIGGYTVWTSGRVVYSTRRETKSLAFDAIWVQRSVSAELALLLDSLSLPFVYDLDDNLLVSPAYRDAFSPESMQAARHFVRTAEILSCSTARLATIVQRHASVPVIQKTVVTKNILRIPPTARPNGQPSCVIWASSDVPALTGGRLAVLKAIRDFCLTHRLRLVCIGAVPPGLLLESAVEIEHIALQPYHAYLELLRSLAPAILVCPLETGSDAATRDFVEGKSDIKILEALAAGLVGVFSAAPAYLESDLPRPILCENTYRSWFEGLVRASKECESSGEDPIIPPERIASKLGTRAYFEALIRVRLAQPLQLATLADHLTSLRSRLVRRMLNAEDFDERFYLAKYSDVRVALDRGTITSAYSHYVSTGFAEQREGREGDTIGGDGEQWWANLIHTISDLKTVIDSRAHQIEDLKARRSMRLRLQQTNLKQ